MATFRPIATINLRNFTAKRETFQTYRDLVKAMDRLTNASYDGVVSVTRSRRGQWGEWFEVWVHGSLIKQGWM